MKGRNEGGRSGEEEGGGGLEVQMDFVTFGPRTHENGIITATALLGFHWS